MKHEVKTEPIIKLELTLEEFEHIMSASAVAESKHKELHSGLLKGDFNKDLAYSIAVQLEEIYNSIK